jgi:hypothetical protein
MKPGTMKLYLATSDAVAGHKGLNAKGANVNEVKDDLFGPGSGVKWFNLKDPDGNQILLVQAQVARIDLLISNSQRIYVKWNSSECGSLADVYAIKACLGFTGYSRNGGLRRRRRRA